MERPSLHPIAALLVAALPAIAGSPDLQSVEPAGAQRGSTLQLTLRGERLGSAQQVHWYGAGITTTAIASVDAGTVTVECAVAPDCPLGEQPFRLRTASGLSSVHTIFIGALPVVDEVEPNSDFGAPQIVPLNSTVSGIVSNEDVDYFAVKVKAGQRLSAEIEGMRLGRAFFDPAIAVLDARRFELAVSDDSALLGQDGAASVIVPSDGVYTVQVREAAYAGGDACRYRLHVGTFPRPRAAWPIVGRPGETMELHWVGEPLPTPPVGLTLPAIRVRAHPLWASDDGGIAPSPNWIGVSDLPTLAEPPPGAPIAEPEAPVAIGARLSAPGELDRFRFKARAGQALDIRILARRLRTPVDPVFGILDPAGNYVGGNDDAVGADPELRFVPPVDGVYEIHIRDHRWRGGEEFVYLLEVAQPNPTLAVSIERIDTRNPQFLQSIVVPRGNRFAVMLRAERENLGGHVAIESPELPAGVAVRTEGIAADLAAAPVLFEAAPDTSLGGGLYPLNARIGETTGGFRQTIPLILGPPNDSVYYQTTVDRIAIAATDPAPFRVRIEQPAAPILRQGTKALRVVVDRDEGFNAEVTTRMLWNPPGISSAGAIGISGTEAHYPLNASGDAPIKSWKLAVLAHAAVDGGDIWISSDFVDVAVADPLFSGAIQLAATEQGKPAALVCKLEPIRPFEGTARLTLLGLPPKTACPPREITPTDREIVFEVATESDAPVGQHRGLFCELELTQGAETMTHRLAYDGILRIDPPSPPPVVAQGEPPPPPPSPPPPGARPLSRLEQLRKDAADKKREGPR